MEAVYRVKQALRGLFAFTQSVDEATPARYLSMAEMTLFQQMRHSEQLHALHVLRDVLAQETETSPDLAVSALLHDVGKSRYTLRIWQKTIAVAVEKLAPSLYTRWSDDESVTLWTRPFAVKAHHPAWGAEMLAQAGSSEGAVWLVAHHQDDIAQWVNHPYYALLRRLQQADDAN